MSDVIVSAEAVAGEVEADGVDAVVVGGVEEEVAEGRHPGHLARRFLFHDDTEQALRAAEPAVRRHDGPPDR
ncbi:hypothetical protein ACIRVF_33645 [Kitasatospora sp. NPDC101157]|uniref:hypothetical protein n=1 Tax=Kitasatospora sp. NPDC101157 TaxID=3364098 RepID=UPI0037F8E69D